MENDHVVKIGDCVAFRTLAQTEARGNEVTCDLLRRLDPFLRPKMVGWFPFDVRKLDLSDLEIDILVEEWEEDMRAIGMKAA